MFLMVLTNMCPSGLTSIKAHQSLQGVIYALQWTHADYLYPPHISACAPEAHGDRQNIGEPLERAGTESSCKPGERGRGLFEGLRCQSASENHLNPTQFGLKTSLNGLNGAPWYGCVERSCYGREPKGAASPNTKALDRGDDNKRRCVASQPHYLHS